MNPQPFRPGIGPGGMPPGGPRPPAPGPDVTPGLEFSLVLLALMLLVALIFALMVAVQARRRGYSMLAWLLAGTLGNPIFLLVLLGAMPDFRRRRLRRKEMDDLETRLGRRGQHRPPDLPRAARQPVRPESIQRSLGDEETRL